jgi:hypothetical protein
MRERLVSSASSTILGTRTSRRHLDSDTKAKDDRGLFRRLVSQASRVGPGERYGYRCCHCHCRSHRRLYHHWLLLSVSSASSIPLARSKNTDGRRCTYRTPPHPPHPRRLAPRDAIRTKLILGCARLCPEESPGLDASSPSLPPLPQNVTRLCASAVSCANHTDAYHTTPIIRRLSYDAHHTDAHHTKPTENREHGLGSRPPRPRAFLYFCPHGS